MNTYKVLLPVLVNGEHTQGDVFEHEFDADAEQTNVQSGLIEIVPREYRVAGPSDVFETKSGEVFTAALLIEQERMLLDGGFIVRVEDTPKKKAAAKK